MAKFDPPIKSIMSDPELSLTSSPFAPGKMIVKRASFNAGETPDHLSGNQISQGECTQTGTRIYDGKEIPATAYCVAQKRSR